MNKTLQANIALSLAAFFWGTTFIFQREAMDHLTPLAYGGLRFTIGALALLPVAFFRARQLLAAANGNESGPGPMIRWWIKGGLISGGLIFVGVTFQQYGLLGGATAGKAGFITSLYVVLVPLILRLAGHRILWGEGLGAALAVVGLYLLSFTGPMSLAPGDGLVLIGAFIWATHVITLGWLSPKMDSIILGTGQALICGILSLSAAAALGQWPAWADLQGAWLDILWGSILSVTLGFTFQVIGQKNANPAPAAIIMQMEAVVAAVAGWLILDEIMSGRMLAGALIMLAGMLISQLWPILADKHPGRPPKAP